MAIDVFVFDFDGVIADTEPLHYQAFCDVIRPYGMDCCWENYLADYIGYDDRDLFLCAFKANGRALDAQALQVLIDAKAQRFVAIIEERGAQAYEGVVDFIRCASRQNIPLALCSGALRSDVTPVLLRVGLADVFRVISTAEDVSASKPDPAPYLHAFQNLQDAYPERLLCIEQCLAFEDTPAGVTSAKSAGLQVVAITNTHRASALQEADLIVNSLSGIEPEGIRKMADACD